jgi:DNA-binding CsgD family transcriptional regulator
LRSDIESLTTRALPAGRLRLEAAERIRHLIPIDGFCISSVDPDSLVITATDAANIDRALAHAFYENEYAQRDFAKHERLARSRRRVAVLEQETRGEPDRSPRYRRIVRAMGFRHELRAALVDRGTAWGFVHLYRAPDRRGFDADEAEAILRASVPLAAGLRTAATAPPAPAGAGGERPVVLLLDGRDRVLRSSGPLDAWLAAMHDPLRTTRFPEVVPSVAASARRNARAGSTARLQAADGSWWVVHGSIADSPEEPARAGDAPVTVVVQPAVGPQLTRIVMRALALSPGERAVCDLLLAGMSTKAIAAELGLSPLTVQDRLKPIFAKAQVGSRQELVARLNPAGAEC